MTQKTPLTTQMPHQLSVAAVTDCTRYPYFRWKAELLRVVTLQMACTQAAPGHHDHTQLGKSSTTEGEVKDLPWSAHLVRDGGLLVAPRRLHCTV